MNRIIDQLMCYAKIHLGLSPVDAVFVRNQIFARLGVPAVAPEAIDEQVIAQHDLPDTILASFKKHYLEWTHLTDADADLMAGELLGLLTPAPSIVQREFFSLYQRDPEKATAYLHQLQVKNDYIKKSLTDQNVQFRSEQGTHYLEMAINLSKPEKRNEDIAKLVKQKVNTDYPSCMICRENLGFKGRHDYPGKANMRIIDLNLDGDPWFFQYSPYAYYANHCIVVDAVHRPMEVSPYAVKKLFAFVDQFPHYFIGSNSDLPIVGGSILNHEHFQGGSHLMPIMTAKVRKAYSFTTWPQVKLKELEWFNTALLLESTDKAKLMDALNAIIASWKTFDLSALDIVSKTDAQHNTATVIVKKNKDLYQVYVILRNNRTNAQYPKGIFAAHPEYHGIKSEGVGLIECMGLFILPARLKREFAELQALVQQKQPLPSSLEYHRPLFNRLKAEPKTPASTIIEAYCGEVCRNILDNSAVFKRDERGEPAFKEYLHQLLNLQ